MKKAIVLAISVTVLGLLSFEANAQSYNSPSTQQPSVELAHQVTDKYQISEEELPNGVKKALKNDVLTDWKVSEVYKVDSSAERVAKATYEVYFINAEKKRAIARYDEKGNSVRDEE